MPPPTLPSKATARPYFRAWAKTSGPCSASSALLAVTTSLPAARASRTIPRVGSIPPIVSMTTDDLGVVDHSRGSVTTLRVAQRGVAVLAGSRTTAHFRWIRRPARRAMRSPCSCSSRTTPDPTVPTPSSPTATCSIPPRPSPTAAVVLNRGPRQEAVRPRPSRTSQAIRPRDGPQGGPGRGVLSALSALDRRSPIVSDGIRTVPLPRLSVIRSTIVEQF